MHHYCANDLRWDGNRLCLRATGRLLASVVPDADSDWMWRVRLPRRGGLSDMSTLGKAKDAALTLALASLNREMPQAA